MRRLNYPDRHHLSAALGWLELGDVREAESELRLITEQDHPEVPEVCWRRAAYEKNWSLALEVARQIVQKAPDWPEGWIHQSYTLHELRRTEEAWNELLSVAARFTEESVIPYNLACYACQMGNLAGAKNWLRKAAQLQSKEEIRKAALNDPDLAPIRDYVQAL